VELRDLRAKVTVEADAALDAVSRATGRDRSEIVRDVLHDWALLRITEASLLLHRLEVEGVAAAPSGTRGRPHS
jgi:hypothetical protein